MGFDVVCVCEYVSVAYVWDVRLSTLSLADSVCECSWCVGTEPGYALVLFPLDGTTTGNTARLDTGTAGEITCWVGSNHQVLWCDGRKLETYPSYGALLQCTFSNLPCLWPPVWLYSKTFTLVVSFFHSFSPGCRWATHFPPHFRRPC